MTDFDNVTINDTLTMKAPSPNQGYAIKLKTVWVTVPTEGPILRIDHGIWGMKDFSCLGFLGSVSKTEIAFGATYTNCVPSDIGKMVKDDGVDTSVLADYDNENKKWWLAGSSPVASGSAMTIVNGTGAGTSSGNSSTYGGGAILMGHGLNAASDPPKISLMDSAQGYDTLHLKKFDGTPAHLDLGNLTAHGNITINKATPILQLKASSGDPIIEFYDTSTLKMNLAYSAVGDYFYLRDIVGSKDVFQATPAGQLALPVNGSTGGLRIGDDAYLYRGSTNTLYVYRNIEPGAGTETGYLGEGGRYWYGLVSKYVYCKYLYQFYDEYDDLSIAKLWGEKDQTLPADYDTTKLKPPTDDPFKIIKGSKEEANTEEFFDVGKVTGFLMGCVKALAKKQDEHDALLLKLLNEVESLRAEIAS